MKTLEQIKKHFENAKLVRCLEWGDYKIKRKSIYADKNGNYWAKCKWTTDHCCLYRENNYADILKSKKSKKLVMGSDSNSTHHNPLSVTTGSSTGMGSSFDVFGNIISI